MLPMPISAQKKALLKNILLSGQANDYYWTQAWQTYIANPNNAMAREQVWFRLAGLHKYIMNMPEYQLI
jgi:flagellar hook-associated protein FlgK